MSKQGPFEPNTEKRLLLALLLSTAVLLTAPYIFRQFFPAPPVVEEAAVQESVVENAEEVPQPVVLPPPVETTTTDEVGSEEQVSANLTQGTSQLVEMRNDHLVVVWNTLGAAIESARLLDYQDGNEQALELVPQGATEGAWKPFQVRVGDEALDQELSAAVYEVDKGAVDSIRGPTEVVFEYRSGSLEVRRKVIFPADGYVFEVETEVSSGGRTLPYSLVVGPGIGMGSAESGGMFLATQAGDFAFPAIAYEIGGKVERYDAGDIEQPETREIESRWVGYDSRFFAYLVMAPAEIRGFRLQHVRWEVEQAEGEEPPAPSIGAEVRVSAGTSFRAFFGPKDLRILKSVDPGLGELIDYGWFAVLVKPLLFCLKLAYGLVGNYGWAIIIVTFFINLVLLPIRYKQITSMKKMSDLQPKIKAIQGRYKKLAKTDPKRQDMNKEIMALYSEHGVNPLGGCLPLLVQMPFLFAFYRMLASSIELRGAPFMLWIQDLSQADPYYITPIVMGATMVAQQKMTPSTGDPAQRRMMMLMPVMFTFFFLSVSSGLVVYFLFSNLFGILFQQALQRLNKEEVVHSSKPRGESKKSGKARTKP